MPVVCLLQKPSEAKCGHNALAKEETRKGMSEEKSKRQRGTGSIYQPKHSRFWWVKYYRNGTPYRESTHETDERKALKFLQNRLGEIATGNFFGPAVERILVSELAEDMLREYSDQWPQIAQVRRVALEQTPKVCVRPTEG